MARISNTIETPKWDALLLICKECRKRKNGSDHLKPKELVKLARVHLKEQRPRPRVVSTSCLGICPKDAVAVAWVGRGMPPRILCTGSGAEFDEAMPLLIPVGAG